MTMTEPTPTPRPGYYADPSVPGFVRYWDGNSWVPGTSRPEPGEGELLPPPPRRHPSDGPSMRYVPPPGTGLGPTRRTGHGISVPEDGESGVMYLDGFSTAPVTGEVPAVELPAEEPVAEEPVAEEPSGAAPEPRAEWAATPHDPGEPVSWGGGPAAGEPGPAPAAERQPGPVPEPAAEEAATARGAQEAEEQEDEEPSLPAPASSWADRVQSLAAEHPAPRRSRPRAATVVAEPEPPAPAPAAAAAPQLGLRPPPSRPRQRPAAGGAWRRIAARLIDVALPLLLTAAAGVPLWFATVGHLHDKIASARGADGRTTVWLVDGPVLANALILLATALLVGFCYEILPTGRAGLTPGKRLLGLRVLDAGTHRPPGIGPAARRWALCVLLPLTGIGALHGLWRLSRRPLRRCAHDRSAGTYVSREPRD